TSDLESYLEAEQVLGMLVSMLSTSRASTRPRLGTAIRVTALTCAAAFAVPQLDAAPPDKKNATSASRLVWQFKSMIPLGSDAIRLGPSRRVVYSEASGESREFKKMRLVTEGEKHVKITDTNGTTVPGMPKHLSFRVTAGTKDRLTDVQPLPFETEQALN